MSWSEDILNKTKQCGVHGYPLAKVLLIIDIEDEAAYTDAFKDPNSDIYKAYAKGEAYAEFAFDNILFKKGTEGDLIAMKAYDERKRLKKFK
jgi:hypothetical protein